MKKKRVVNKIFFVGFRRTGTMSLTRVLEHCYSYKVLHGGRYDYSRDLSVCPATIGERYNNNSKQVISEHDAFIDMENLSDNFKELYYIYPDAKFIFNTRESEGWINSCGKHYKGIKNSSKDYDKRFTWHFDKRKDLEYYDSHTQKVRAFFKNKESDRFLVLRVCEGDRYDKLCPFLGEKKPSFSWPHLHKSNG